MIVAGAAVDDQGAAIGKAGVNPVIAFAPAQTMRLDGPGVEAGQDQGVVAAVSVEIAAAGSLNEIGVVEPIVAGAAMDDVVALAAVEEIVAVAALD
jgi:hypothetical protein